MSKMIPLYEPHKAAQITKTAIALIKHGNIYGTKRIRHCYE